MTSKELLQKILEIEQKINLEDLANSVTKEEINFVRENLSEALEKVQELCHDDEYREKYCKPIMKELHKLILAPEDKVFSESILNKFSILVSSESIKLIAPRLGDKDYILKMIYDSSFKLYEFHKEALVEYLNEPALMEEWIRNVEALNSFSRSLLIEKLYGQNQEKLKEIVLDKSLKLESPAIRRVLMLIEDANFIMDFLENSEFNLDARDKGLIIAGMKDISRLRKFLKDFKQKGLTFEDAVEAVIFTQNEEFMSEFLEENFDKLTPVQVKKLICDTKNKPRMKEFFALLRERNVPGKILELLVEEIKEPAYFKIWQEECSVMRDFPQISVDLIKKSPKLRYVKILTSDDRENIDYYTRDEYIQIRSAIDEILRGIKRPKLGDFESELNVFCEVFKRLSRIKYDNDAITEEAESSQRILFESRSLYGGLVNGKCVCAGFAKALKVCLKKLGIEAKFISGYEDEEHTNGHAWNQVRIGGVWFNCDLTNDRELGLIDNGISAYRALRSDKEFGYFDTFLEARSRDEKKCDMSIIEALEKILGISEQEIPETTDICEQDKKSVLREMVKKLASHITMSDIKNAHKKLNTLLRGKNLDAKDKRE